MTEARALVCFIRATALKGPLAMTTVNFYNMKIMKQFRHSLVRNI